MPEIAPTRSMQAILFTQPRLPMIMAFVVMPEFPQDQINRMGLIPPR